MTPSDVHRVLSPKFVPLSHQRHGALCLLSGGGEILRQAAHSGAAAICRAELERAVPEFPLAFLALPGERARLVAVLGSTGSNLFVGADGRWRGKYVPASVRLQPFGWEQRAAGEVVLCVDESSPMLTTKRGVPLFDAGGAPTEVVRRAAEVAGHLVRDLARTDHAATALLRAGVLEPWALPLPSPASDAVEALSVSEDRLRALGAETLQVLMAADALMLAHAQLLSRGLIANLYALQEERLVDAGRLASLEFKF